MMHDSKSTMPFVKRILRDLNHLYNTQLLKQPFRKEKNKSLQYIGGLDKRENSVTIESITLNISRKDIGCDPLSRPPH